MKFHKWSTRGCFSLVQLYRLESKGKRTKPKRLQSACCSHHFGDHEWVVTLPMLCFSQLWNRNAGRGGHEVLLEEYHGLGIDFPSLVFGFLLTSLFFSWRVRWLVCKTVGCEYRTVRLWHPDPHLCSSEIWWAEACDRLLWQHCGLLGMEFRSQDPALPGAHRGGWVALFQGFLQLL